jgi:Glycosyltransferase family 87
MIVLALCEDFQRLMNTSLESGVPTQTLSPRAMRRRQPLVLTVVLVLTGSMWFYLNYVGPQAKKYQGIRDEINDTHGDLFAPWYGSRELFLHHRDPYSTEVTREIQNEYYGKELTGAPHEPKDQQRFAYPLYLAFLFAPFAHVSFETVRLIFRWLLPAITLATIPAWLRLVGVKNSLFLTMVIAALSFTSVPVFRGLNLQQLTLLVFGLIAVCAVCMVRGQYLLAGISLALASMKPQMAILPSAWLVLWVFWNWPERKRFLWGFVPTLAVLLLGAELILPGWFPEFVKGALAYRRYAAGGNLAESYLPGAPSLLLSVPAFAMIAAACWLARKQSAGSIGFAFAFCTVLAFSVLVVPALSAVFNQVLFLPAILLPLRLWENIWVQGSRARVAFLLFVGALVLPWLSAIAVLLVWVLFHTAALHRIWGLPLYVWQLAPFAIMGLLVFMMKDVLRESQQA